MTRYISYTGYNRWIYLSTVHLATLLSEQRFILPLSSQDTQFSLPVSLNNYQVQPCIKF